jgi:hypothetical protein
MRLRIAAMLTAMSALATAGTAMATHVPQVDPATVPTGFLAVHNHVAEVPREPLRRICSSGEWDRRVRPARPSDGGRGHGMAYPPRSGHRDGGRRCTHLRRPLHTGDLWAGRSGTAGNRIRGLRLRPRPSRDRRPARGRVLCHLPTPTWLTDACDSGRTARSLPSRAPPSGPASGLRASTGGGAPPPALENTHPPRSM